MISSADLFGMVDPICCSQVDANSTHHCVHGGALFSFCSDECRARFAEDPSRWAVSALLGGVRSGAPGAERESAERETPVAATLKQNDDFGDTVAYRRPLHAAVPVTIAPMLASREPLPFATGGVDLELDIPEVTARTLLTEPTGQFTRPPRPMVRPTDPEPSTSPVAAPVPPPDERAPLGMLKLFSPLTAWRERQSATACCRELLKLYHIVAADHPGWDRMARYRQVVIARTGQDAAAANTILRLAEESFASWPASRDLNFRDVVHYLAVAEFLAAHPGSGWVHADMRRIVQSAIPHEL